MKSFEILHEVGIKASADAVYHALTDTKGLSGWWTSDTRGSGTKVGGELQFWFGEFSLPVEVTALEPNQLVRWRCKMPADDEWSGTELTFKLTPDENQVWVRFSHSGWKSDQGVLSHCSTKWAVFMLSLKDLLEKGKGHPAPHDWQINHD